MKHTHVILLALLPFFVACKDDDPVVPSEPENEEELITTVNAYFDLKDSDETTTASWLDLDGPGGNDPVIQGATLLPDTVYTLRL